MVIVTVMYPNTGKSGFDMEYYLGTHTPLVKKRFAGLGLESLELMRGTAALNGGEPGFLVLAQLRFTSLDHLRTALEQHGEEIIGDIPKFTDVQPLMQINESL